MQQNTQRPVSSIAYPILIALSISHCLNDLLQSVITATYPLFKEDLTLSFAQIGLITLVYQMSASVFQPVFGLFFDKRPFAWTLPMGMLFTMTGLLNLAFSTNLYWVLFSVFIIGIGSSVLHPEASRITSLASGGRRGLAQSLFQVGGNLGGSFGTVTGSFNCSALWQTQHRIIRNFISDSNHGNDTCRQMVQKIHYPDET